MAFHEIPGGLNVLVTEPKELLRPADQRGAKPSPQKKSGVVTEHRRTNARHDDPLNREIRLLVGQKTREHEHRLSWKGQPGTFSQEPQQDCPIAPGCEYVSNRVVEPMH